MLINFQLYTKKVPLDPNVDLRTIAASCNGYVGADLEALCREAAIIAVKRSSDANEDAGVLSLTIEDWEHARSIVGPSITRGVTVEIPKVTWEDIGGLKDLKVCNINFSFCIESLMELLRTPFFLFLGRKSSGKLLSGLLNILLHFQGWEYLLYEEFFSMGLQDAQKPPLLKLQLMPPKLLFFP